MRSSTAAPQTRNLGFATILRSRPKASRGSELPDIETGRLFRDLRTVLCLSVPQAAACLRAHPSVIDALESGCPERLPGWPETVRIVSAYTRMAQIEPAMVLERLRRQIAAHVVRPEPPDVRTRAAAALQHLRAHAVGQASGVMGLLVSAPATLTSRRSVLASSLAAGQARPSVRMAAAAVLACLALAGVAAPSSLLQASVSSVRKPLTSLLHSVSDQMSVLLAPVREGHRWIDVDDPRSRRSDKLRIAHR
jgi:hypothetical protein